MTLLNPKIKLFVFALTFAFLFACSVETIFAQKRMPRFKDYPVAEIYKGKNARLKLTRGDKMFRTRLKWAVDNQEVNFAGHYILTSWGCGTECLQVAAIDAITGKVYWLGLFIRSWSGERDENFTDVEFRTNSKLIIFFGEPYSVEGGASGTYYYKFENGRLVLLQSVLSKEKL